MRKYEIAVLSKGACARTLKIHTNKKTDRAVIVCGNKDIAAMLEHKKKARATNLAIVTVEGTPVPYGYLPFAAADNCSDGNDGKALCAFLLDAVIPYLDKRFGFESYALLGTGAAGVTAIYAASQKCERIVSYAAFSAPLFIGGADFAQYLKQSGLSNAAYYLHADCNIKDIDEATQSAFISSATETYALVRAYSKNAKLRIDGDANKAVEEFLSDFSEQ